VAQLECEPELGARLAQPGEFTRRAYLNDKLDLAQAESVADLIDAATEEAARCAVRYLRGAFSKRIVELVQSLIDLRVQVEAAIDFPEEEVEFLGPADGKDGLAALCTRMQEVLSASQQGSLLREGIHVVLAGQPNVGKSSLLNRLAGEDLAIVTEIPGTTRDAIRQSVNLEGVAAHVIDTAGLRESSDPVEKIGIARTWAAIEKADLVVLLIDATHGETAADRKILSQLPVGLPCIKAMNKIDLEGISPATMRSGDTTTVWLSARTGAGPQIPRCRSGSAAGRTPPAPGRSPAPSPRSRSRSRDLVTAIGCALQTSVACRVYLRGTSWTSSFISESLR